MASRRGEKMKVHPRCHNRARRRAQICHQAFLRRTTKGDLSPQLLMLLSGSLGRVDLPLLHPWVLGLPVLDPRAPACMARSLPPAGTVRHPWLLMVTHRQCLDSTAICHRHRRKEVLPQNGSGIHTNTRLHPPLIKASTGGHPVHRQACHLVRIHLALPLRR